MKIIIIKKDTLLYDEFKFKCSIGKNGSTTKKIEGDNKTPRGLYTLGPLYYRKNRILKLSTKLKKIEIKKNFGWCDDVKSKYYNKPIKINNKIRFHKSYNQAVNLQGYTSTSTSKETALDFAMNVPLGSNKIPFLF